MLYIDGGAIVVVRAGTEVKEFVALERAYKKKKDRLADVLRFLFFVYTYGVENPYAGLTYRERKLQAVKRYGLFGLSEGSTKPEIDKVLDKLYKEEAFANFRDFYESINLTVKQRVIESLKRKIDNFTQRFTETDDPKLSNDLFSAITNAQKMLDKYEEETSAESTNDGSRYLFQIPENIKPHHLRL